MMTFRMGRVPAAILLIGALAVPQAIGAAPEPTDPEGMAMGLLPGQYPTGVTAANIDITQFTPSELNGTNSDNYRVTFPNAGPIPWTSSRHNEGDFALSIGPGGTGPEYFPPNDFVNNRRPIADGEPFSESTIAWRVNQQTGGLLASVRHNGVNYGTDYTYVGTPVGVTHGIAYFGQDFGQGWGYRMGDGVFANGGEGSSDLIMGVAGYDGGNGEAGSNVAVSYFPYEQGWIGAWVNGGDEGEGTFGASSPDLPTSTVNWAASQANVKLDGVNSATDGMLFVAPTNGNNLTNIAASFPNPDGGWTVTVREDEDSDVTGYSYLASNENGFQFLYIPYTAHNLIGGYVDGSNGSMIHAAGESLFDLGRNSAGEYELSVFGADGETKLGEEDGMLVLSVSKEMEGAAGYADRSFLSYEYDAESGNFVIQSRQVTATNSPQSENQFGDLLGLTDSDFYFAWVDFTNPLAPLPPSGVAGDFNGNGTVENADLTLLLNNWGQAVPPVPAGWVGDQPTGDAIDNSELTALLNNWGSSAGAAASTAVPEPTSILLLAAGLAILPFARRR